MRWGADGKDRFRTELAADVLVGRSRKERLTITRTLTQKLEFVWEFEPLQGDQANSAEAEIREFRANLRRLTHDDAIIEAWKQTARSLDLLRLVC